MSLMSRTVLGGALHSRLSSLSCRRLQTALLCAPTASTLNRRTLSSRILDSNCTSHQLQCYQPPSLSLTTFRTSTNSASSSSSVASAAAAEVRYGNWIDRFPPSIRPYLFLTRLDKPAGTWLLYWPCTWSIGMAAYNGNISPSQTLWMLSVFGVGALVMRGAGCTINDMWDVKFDKKVERTRIRPLASGALTMPKATAFLAGQLTVGLGVLLQLNMYSIALGALSLVPVAVYPLMKRITYWPQTVLGLAFNWGALLGWPALLGGDLMNWSVTVPMYVAGISWTLVYDTIYAHQDKRDDVHAGVKSTALLFGDKSRLILSGFAVSTVALLCIAGAANGHGPIYYATTVLGGGGHLAWQLKTVDFNNVANCWHRFKSNIHFGAIIFAGIALDYLYKRYIEQSEKEDTSDKVKDE